MTLRPASSSHLTMTNPTISVRCVFFLLSVFSFSFTFAFFPSTSNPLLPIARRQERLSPLAASPRIRDWNSGEGAAILDLLRSAEDGSFNPEGGLEMDCQTETLLRESYDPEDGGCFVVACDDDDTTITGAAGLIVGTPVEYQASGASTSSAETTAAIRRCCCNASINDSDQILEQLVTTLEERAIQARATQVIALAYPPTSSSGMAQKPTPTLLEKLGYEKLSQQLPGVDAIQYGKPLQQPQATTTANADNASDLVGSVVAIGALGFLLGGMIAVAQFVGFDTTVTAAAPEMDQINRGLGRSLSSEDLGQLMEDEKLQRKTLDGSSDLQGREWKDLSLEEQREEMALLGIINGKDVRIK